MMSNYTENDVRLIGRVMRVGLLKKSSNDEDVFDFAIQTTSRSSEATHRVAVFNKLALNSAKFFREGDQVIVKGELDYITWGEHGDVKETAVIRAHSAFRLNKAQTSNQQGKFENQKMPKPATL